MDMDITPDQTGKKCGGALSRRKAKERNLDFTLCSKDLVFAPSTPSHTHIATRTSCAISKMFKNPKKTLTEIVESKSKKDYKDVIFSTAGFLLWMSIIQNLNLRYFIQKTYGFCLRLFLMRSLYQFICIVHLLREMCNNFFCFFNLFTLTLAQYQISNIITLSFKLHISHLKITLNTCLGRVGRSFCFVELNYITSHSFLSH